jgi:hypothetical protein
MSARDDARRRDVHALDADGMIACNPRDPEAAHRADVAKCFATSDRRRVTCAKCLAIVRSATSSVNPAGDLRHRTDVTTSSQRWRVMRQDDNGNVFVVAVVANEDAARSAAAEYEARGHKQMYWVEPVDE